MTWLYILYAYLGIGVGWVIWSLVRLPECFDFRPESNPGRAPMPKPVQVIAMFIAIVFVMLVWLPAFIWGFFSGVKDA